MSTPSIDMQAGRRSPGLPSLRARPTYGREQGRGRWPGGVARVATTVMALVCLLVLGTRVWAYEFYFGNFHSHSTLSDGSGPPDDAFAYARDVANIDILALSEHTHMTTQNEWLTLGDKAAQYTQSGVFVALQSQEFGILNDFGHLNIHGAANRNPNATTNLPATYNFIELSNAVGSFCHPNPTYGTWFDNLAFYSDYVDAMVGMEVVNGLAGSDYESTWIFALNNGWKLAPQGNQDNHETDWGNRSNPNDGGRIYLTGVLADSLTTNEVLDALRARRFYALEERPPGDRIELEFTIDGSVMGSDVTVGASPLIEATTRSTNGASLFNRIELYKDGVIVHSHIQVGTEISMSYVDALTDGEAHYYFVRVRQVDGDFAWSAPIWVDAEVTASSVDGGPTLQVPGIGLRGPAPNPFVHETDIRFVLPSAMPDAQIGLTVHDLSGRLVADLGARTFGAGEQVWTFDGRDGAGRRLPAGVYLYRLTGDRLGVSTGRMVLLAQ